MLRRDATACAVALLTGALAPMIAHAQGTGRSMDIDVSARSAAMGGASNAVFWGGDLNHWGNPALMGYARGLRFEYGRTQLVPDLADDVIFTSQVLKLGAHGAGVVLSGPVPEGVHLSYGESEGTDPSGNPTGTFESFEDVESIGFGVSLFRVLENLAGFGETASLRPSRHFDVSYGMNFKRLEMDLGAGLAGETDAQDWGIHARLTPVDVVGPQSVRVEVGYGYSVLSANDDARVDFGFIPEGDAPVSRHERHGLALHVEVDSPAWRLGSGPKWLREGYAPLISVGVASQWNEITAGGAEPGYETEGYGAELTLANVLTVRGGNYEDREGDIDGATWGFGIALPIGRVAGLRYDQARFPQADGLDEVVRHAGAVWLDPIELARAVADRSTQLARR
jgi:hypothetical protein